jgi:DHA1 family multidrug resistance protein-like MFS transporter
MILLVKETLSDSLKEKLKTASAGKKRSISGFITSAKGLGAVVGIFLASVLIYRIGYTMIDPFFSLYLRDVLSINLSLTSYIFAVRALAMIAFAPLAGIFTDRWGRKNAVLLGLALSVVTLIGYTYAFDFFPMLILKGLDGVTWSVLLTAINTLMSDMLSPEMRGFGMGLQSAISQQSSTIGSIFSGFLIDAYGFNLVFYLAAGAAVLSLLVVLGFVPEPKRRKLSVAPAPLTSH